MTDDLVESSKGFPKRRVIVKDNNAFIPMKSILCVYYISM